MLPAQLSEWFSRTVGFPLIVNGGWRPDKDRRRFSQLLREKLESQFWPAGQLEAWQLQRLRPLLAHAGQTVPYYRDLFRETGFDPRGLDRLADLSALPPLTRQTVQAQGRRMLADGAAGRGLTTGQTSGTSGVPLDFWRDRSYDRHLEAAAWMSDMAAGRRFGSPTAYLWGWTPFPSRYQRLLARLRNVLRNEQRYNTRQMPDAVVRQFHLAMQAHPPDILVAYPSGAARLAQYLERRAIKPEYPRLALIPTGEVLEPEMRAAIERVFPAPIFSRYGSRELGLMAFECSRHAGLHVNAANVILECVGPDAYREPGELIITQLHSYAMPLIRYQVDDLAVLERQPCTCGRTTSMLRRVIGRKMLNFITPAGTPVETYFLISKVRQMANVVEFQLIQQDPRHLRLLVVPGPGCRTEQFAEARATIHEMMGAECELAIDFVEDIPRPPSGKLQMLVSMLPVDGSAPAIRPYGSSTDTGL